MIYIYIYDAIILRPISHVYTPTNHSERRLLYTEYRNGIELAFICSAPLLSQAVHTQASIVL